MPLFSPLRHAADYANITVSVLIWLLPMFHMRRCCCYHATYWLRRHAAMICHAMLLMSLMLPPFAAAITPLPLLRCRYRLLMLPLLFFAFHSGRFTRHAAAERAMLIMPLPRC